jgi:hypothetical protein
LILSIATSTFLVPNGMILMGMSVVYFAVALGCCVDWPVIVLARRELAAYFLSPVAYLVFIGQLIFGWIMFELFYEELLLAMRDPRSGGMFEPIVIRYILSVRYRKRSRLIRATLLLIVLVTSVVSLLGLICDVGMTERRVPPASDASSCRRNKGYPMRSRVRGIRVRLRRMSMRDGS